MRKQKSTSMKMDDDYTAATKRLIKKTLIGFGVTILVLIVMGVWVFKKATSPKDEAEVASATTEIQQSSTPAASPALFETSAPLPTSSATPSPSPSPTASGLPSSSPSATPTVTPSVAPTTKSSPTPTSSVVAPLGKTISSQSNLDGFQTSNGTGSTAAEIRVGRNNTGISRGFISFDLSQAPPSGSITKVMLKVYQQGTTGNPYTVGSDIKVDHLNYGSTFEASDYSTSSISSSFAVLSSNTSQGWKEVEVTQNIKGDLTAGRPRSQFRLHNAIEQIGRSPTGDYALFESGDNSLKTGNIPQLVFQHN